MRVAYFHASVEDFLRKDEESILGTLVRSQEFSLEHQQRGAWLGEINLLKRALVGFERGYILLEFVIPRMGKRADVVLLIDGAIFVIEFKVGAGHFAQSAIEQVHDYALDLKNFHKGSHNLPIVPVLVATEATFPRQPQIKFAPDGVAQPALIVMAQLPELIKLILDGISSQALDVG
ncbi:MAG: hypothetical protein RLZZ501_2015, partial [Pseudomonadota bacterium]